MNRPNKCGVVASALSVFAALVVLLVEHFEDNGRVLQEGGVVELFAFVLFGYAAIRGSKWWLLGPVTVVAFWVIAAHIDFLWK